ncbi:MFS transporter [Streptococcus orisratti]|uniref:MFS transporter n=1 Tax=Streptococcus orisratti TaxID=114652 RepID=UPI00039B4350|nr:MFS transporter [Streptococcus orisratti]
MAIAMPLLAFLINTIPTKRLYLFSLGIFLLGVLIAFFAPTFPILMAARALQAIGNGIMTSMAQVVLLTIYPPEKREVSWAGMVSQLVQLLSWLRHYLA